MRILFTLHNFYPERLYGAEEVCIGQLRELIRRGHDVGLFYACNEEVDRGFLVGKGLGELKLYRNRFARTKGQVLLSAWKPNIVRHFAKSIDEFKPDIVVFHHLVRLSLDLPFLASRRHIPVVYYLHDFYSVCPSYSLLNYRGDLCSGGSIVKCSRCLYFSRLKSGWSRVDPMFLLGVPFLGLRSLLLRRLPESVDLFVSPSKFLLEELQRHEFTCKRSRVIPYGIEPVETSKAPRDRADVRFGFLGNVHRKKGIEVLARAFRGSLAKSLIIRGFPDQNSIQRFRELFPDCDAKLELFDSDRNAFYDKVDVVVVPSIWYENQPRVIIEAFACRKPVICSNIGGMAEMVQNGVSGILFTAGDADDLRAKAIYLRDNPSEVFELTASAPRWPTTGEQVDRLLEAFSQLSDHDSRIRPGISRSLV